MANATVQKLKTLGLRHGEKAVVAITACLCLLFFVLAVAKPTLDLTAGDVKNHAEQAAQNIDRPQKEEDILAKLEQEGLTTPAFEKTVDQQSVVAIDAAQFALLNPWVTPEPGAGLIRDMPELLAPNNLYARAGRGGALVYALDESGNRIVETVKEEVAKPVLGRGRRITGGGGSGGMMGGYALGGGSNKSAAELEAEKKAERKRNERLLSNKLAGKADSAKEKELEEEEARKAAAAGQKYKEETKGLRWVALVATLEYKKLRENYAAALKLDFTSAYPNFKRLDIERQELQTDGSWTDWQPVNRDHNLMVLNNIPEADEELTLDEARLETVTDLLPFLRAGYWKGVHVASLVPREKRELPKEKATAVAGGGRGGGGSSAFAQMEEAMSRNFAPDPEANNRSGGGSAMMGTMSANREGGGTAENTNFPKTDAEEIMLRSLDFTVEPDTTYKFRLRIVVVNPNKGREDVSPGVDTKAAEVLGPWCDPSEEVSVPADVTAYAMYKHQGGENMRSDLVNFQVVRWTPDDGLTVYKSFEAGPGQILGEARGMQVPNYDDATAATKPTRSKQVDFNTRQMVLDTAGGFVQPPRLPGLASNTFNDPTMALLLRPDGLMVLRDQAVDNRNDEMAEMKEIYDRAMKEIEDSKKPAGGLGGRSSSGGSAGMSRP